MAFSTNIKSRAFIVVVHIQNMINTGLSEEEYMNPQFLGDTLIGIWENSGQNRTGAVAVCMSKNNCYHAHMALYTKNSTTLKCVSDILFQSHVEPQLGGKKELSAYMQKEGKYEEKGETVLYTKNLDVIQDVRGKRNDIEDIEEMLLKGLTPQQILEQSFSNYKYEKMILHAYIDMRIAEAPVKQDVYCEYHVGESGSGKTYEYNLLCNEQGAENVYVLTDYDNNASGGFDSYMKNGAPPILFMDEFKGYGIPYGKLLTMLNGYTRMQTHSRYSNSYNLWEKVYITSVYPPEAVYRNMVSDENRDVDSFKQLMRRINKVVYHYIEDGEYKTYAVESKDYVSYETLKFMARNKIRMNGFESASGVSENPFERGENNV